MLPNYALVSSLAAIFTGWRNAAQVQATKSLSPEQAQLDGSFPLDVLACFGTRVPREGSVPGIGFAHGELAANLLGSCEDSSVGIEQKFVRAERCG